MRARNSRLAMSPSVGDTGFADLARRVCHQRLHAQRQWPEVVGLLAALDRRVQLDAALDAVRDLHLRDRDVSSERVFVHDSEQVFGPA